MSRPSAERMREIARRWIAEGWQKGDVGVVEHLHSPAFGDHDPAGRPADNEGFKQGIASLFAAFPDLDTVIQELVIDTQSGTVAVRWTATGTHRGEYLGAPASGREIRFKGIEIIRIRDGRIVERWGEWDGIDLLVQLGRITL